MDHRLRDTPWKKVVEALFEPKRQNPFWSDEEQARLRRLYPEATEETILAAFTGKTWGAISQYASRKLKLRRIRREPSNPKRTMSSDDAARMIGMSPSHFKKVHAKNIPHDTYANNRYLFDPEDVRDWYRRELAEGNVVDKQLHRIPKETASKRLRAIYQKLPLSAEEFAKKLRISLGAFRNYIEARYDTPAAVLTDAEALFMEFEHGVLPTAKIPIEKAAKELITIQRKLGLTVKEFSELLRLSRNTLNSYLYPKINKVKFVPSRIIQRAKKLVNSQLPKRHRASIPTEEMVRSALQTNSGVQARAAEALRISPTRLTKLIANYKLESLVKQRATIDRYSKKDLEHALATTHGNITEAAKLLEIDKKTLYMLLRVSGLKP